MNFHLFQHYLDKVFYINDITEKNNIFRFLYLYLSFSVYIINGD